MRNILTVMAVMILALSAAAQQPTGDKVIFTGRYGPAFPTFKTLAPAQACTTDFNSWYWAGSISDQVFVGGKPGDSVIINNVIKWGNNPNDPLSWQSNKDSLTWNDTLIGKDYGNVYDYSLLIPCSYGGVHIARNASWTSDTGKYFNIYPCVTPGR